MLLALLLILRGDVSRDMIDDVALRGRRHETKLLTSLPVIFDLCFFYHPRPRFNEISFSLLEYIYDVQMKDS